MKYSKKLQRILKAYYVRLVKVPYGGIPTGMGIPNTRLGVGCDPGTRCIYVDQTQQQEGGLLQREELILHELCHIVVQPPHMALKDVPELAILLPFEHALLTQHQPEHLERGESFQYGTDIRVLQGNKYYPSMEELRSEPRPDKYLKTEQELQRNEHFNTWLKTCYDHPLFLEGVSLCKRLGLLNRSGEVNLGKYPCWQGSFKCFRARAKALRPQEAPMTALPDIDANAGSDASTALTISALEAMVSA